MRYLIYTIFKMIIVEKFERLKLTVSHEWIFIARI